MKVRPTVLILLGLLVAAGVWFFWPRAAAPVAEKSTAPAPVVAANNAAAPVAATNPPVAEDAGTPSAASTNRLAFRVSNTPKSFTDKQAERELIRDPHLILLENAFIDTSAKVNLNIPSHLRAGGEPGAYLVQSRGAIDGAFRTALAGAGASIVSYIPNNAFLVQVSAAGAAALQENSRVQAVLPYEPYYKVQSSLLGLAVNRKPLPAGMYLTLGIFPGGAEATVAQIQKMGAEIMAQERSPFGSLVRVRPPADWIALANLPGVQLVEPTHLRIAANDLTRVGMGVSTNSTNLVNYLNLYGSNVLVEVNDTGVDPTHPDFAASIAGGPTRVNGDFTNSLSDTDGHGTHVAGIIAGNGSQSGTINSTTAPYHRPSGSVTNANFRGKAPLAKLFSVGFLGHDVFATSDSYLQEKPAQTNALISNNSWINDGDNAYDLSAASYDAAVRDALPETTGPQPVLFVFAAGNDGGGNDGGTGGNSDTILSPATAKNVITVGAMEEFRNITNTYLPLGSTNPALAWQGETDSPFQVAAYSARGNVGVQTEGTFGRFKPDVIAPGTFTVSLRSSVWDEKAYYNPTNYHNTSLPNHVVNTNTLVPGFMLMPQNAVGVSIRVFANKKSPVPFPGLPIYVSDAGTPNPAVPASYDILRTNLVSIPPDSGGTITDISVLENGSLSYVIGDGTNFPVNFDIQEQIITTNDLGNQLEVLSNLNNSIGGDPDSLNPPHYYRYETGTSMAAPAVSGVLALMQDFFTNTLHQTPSPALLKAMLVNGARVQGSYRFAVTNTINFQGWGLVKLTNSIPSALTNTSPAVTNTPMFFVDQSPTNALATGDRRTYLVTVPTAAARSQPLRVTLAWTDPPGNPAAAIKLVNDLDLIVTNLDNGKIYYANNFAASGTPPFSLASTSNSVPALDAINNVENVYISSTLATNYSVTIIGHAVNVNAVTLEQTNIVQDFALVIANGDGQNTNGVSVAAAVPGFVPAIAPNVTFLPATNGIYFNQVSGANAPWLSTNDLSFGTNSFFATNAVFHIGQTNQWHFFVVTNTTIFTNAAFIVFLPNTLAIPRQGVFADSTANSTRPEADLEMLVASAPDPNAGQLTNFNQTVISNCLFKVNGDSSSVGRGGTEFVAYSNSALGQVYFIGVQCQDQMAGQYGFVPIFSEQPFSQTDSNGNEYVTGLRLPVAIPDGNNAHPGVGYVFGLALTPIEVRNVIVTNTFSHQNFGDLLGALSHSGGYAILNNHDGFGAVTPGVPPNPFIYDDSGQGNVPGAIHTDGPGALTTFRGKEGIGPWLMTQVDDSQSQTGSVTGFNFKLEPHRDLSQKPFINVTVPPGGWFYDFIDVPVGYTNLLVVATNIPPTSVPPIQLYLNVNDTPTFSNFLARVELTNGIVPGNEISYGPPLLPGRYFVGLYNPDTVSHDVLLGVTLSFSATAITTVDWNSAGSLALLDDAVTYDSMFVTNRELMQTFQVGLRVDHPRISDLVFHLVSPDGTRYLLMENRGGQSTNGCGVNYTVTNIVPAAANGGRQAATNTIDTGVNPGSITISYDFFTVPDQMQVYNGSTLIFDSGFVNHSNTITLAYSNSSVISIIMNPNGNPSPTAWIYTLFAPRLKYAYLTFTEDTNLTTTPIKFAPPPFVPLARTNVTYQTNVTFLTNSTVVSLSSFEAPAAGEYLAASTVDGWTVASNQVSVVSDPAVAQAGNKYLALASGSISRTLTTIPGGTNTLKFAYRGPGIVSLWRGEINTNAFDSISGNNGRFTNDISFGSGEVNSAFQMGNNGFVFVPASPSLDVGSGGFTVEGWVYPTNLSVPNPIVEWSQGNGVYAGVHFYVSSTAAPVPGCLFAGFIVSNNPAAGGGYATAANIVAPNVFQHVALTLDHQTGVAVMYLNGTNVFSQNVGVGPWWTTGNVLLGRRINTGTPSQNFHFFGKEDEISIYRRTLSASEIKAISQRGIAGKADFAAAFPQNLAKLNYTLGGVTTAISGANTNWLTNTVPFVATSNTTSFKLDGLQPGMLLDSFTLTSFTAVTNVVTNTAVVVSNLYYFPEQSLDPLIRTSPFGEWQLEILDNRAGAAPTNPPAQLVSWQLEFKSANTNAVSPPVFPVFTNDFTIIESNLLVVTNTAIPGRTNLILSYYLLDPPAGCTIGTNTGIIMWIPDESQGPSTNTIVTVVYDNSSPVNYSTNSFTVIVLETNLPPLFLFPTNTTVISIPETIYYTANCVATDPDLPFNTVTFQLLSPTNLAGLTVTTNGVITWTPDETNGPSTNVITIVATDTNPPAINQKSFSVTNRFTLIVLESNLPPVLFLPPNTNINEGVAWSAQATATDPDSPTNTLTFALVGVSPALAGSQLTVSSGGVIGWTPDELQGPGDYTVTVSVSDNGTPPLSATNFFTIHVNEVNLVPVPRSIPDTNIFELTLLTVDDSASDPDAPSNTLSYALFVTSLNTNAPAVTNAFINPTNGIITWRPTEAQGPGDYLFKIVATDTNPPSVNPTSFSVTNSFIVHVFETNTAPFWTNSFPAVTMDELTVTNIFVTALDTDTPPNTLTYTLTNSPVWASINATSGVVTLAPLETNGPSTNLITVRVTDNGVPPLSATTNFTVIVNEVNLAPYWATNVPGQTNFVVNELTLLTVTNTASDDDVPTNVLTYMLSVVSTDTNAPPVTNAVISTNGIITWTPTEVQGPGVYVFTTIVTDTNAFALTNQVLSATNSFTVTVNETNSTPFWTNSFPAVTLDELTTNIVNAAAQDADIPTNTLTYTLTNSPVWAGINATSGVITLTPQEIDGPTNVVVTVIVTDNGVPSLSATTNFTVIVNEVNSPPFWAANTPTNYLVVAPNTFVLTNSATDTDMPTNVLTYFLLAAPTNAAIDTNTGVIAWATTNGVVGSNYLFITVVTDTNVYALTNRTLSATNTFTVTIIATNTAPFWTNPIADVTWDELTTNNIFVTALDTDTPPNNLTYTLLNAPAGMTITTTATNGVITWIPSEAQGPGVYSNILVVVSDNVFPTPLTATNAPFSVTVNEVNSAPVLFLPATTNINELVAWSMLINAFDSDIPTNALTFTLVSATNTAGLPVIGLTVTTNGLISWTPDETNGPSTNIVTISVTDTNVAALVNRSISVTNSFIIVVREVNTAPQFILTPASQTIAPLTALVVTNAATDSDIPTNTLVYRLLNPPAGAAIDTNNGVITWTPSPAQAGTTNTFTTVVRDNGVPPLNATNVFTVIVTALNTNPPSIFSIIHTNLGGTNGFLITWFAPTNQLFKVQWEDTLAPSSWQSFSNLVGYDLFISPTNSRFTFFDDGSQTGGFGPTRFYRLVLFGLGAAAANTPPVLPPQPTRFVTPLSPLTVTNQATDADLPAQTLTYAFTHNVAGLNVPVLNTNTGVITWTPTLAQAGTTNTLTTTVTDNGTPNLSATNSFLVIVNPIPAFSSAIVSTNGVNLLWFGSTNEQFRVQWATNLMTPIAWTLFPGIITSTNGTFTFTDTNAPLLLKFYELLLLP